MRIDEPKGGGFWFGVALFALIAAAGVYWWLAS